MSPRHALLGVVSGDEDHAWGPGAFCHLCTFPDVLLGFSLLGCRLQFMDRLYVSHRELLAMFECSITAHLSYTWVSYCNILSGILEAHGKAVKCVGPHAVLMQMLFDRDSEYVVEDIELEEHSHPPLATHQLH